MKKVTYIVKRLQLNMLFVLIVTVQFANCSKLVEIDAPPTSITSANAYTENATAISVLTGIYINISSTSLNNISGLPAITKWAGLSADEFTLWTGSNTQSQAYYQNNLRANGSFFGHELWTPIYTQLYTCNSAIEGLTKSATLTPSVKQQLLGEAKFIRGLYYFYLVNLFGEVPLVTGTNYEVNRLLPRSPIKDVYEFIIGDLKDAQKLLNDKFIDGKLVQYDNQTTAERTRPSKWAATALLARAFLYTGEYKKAEDEATAIINNSSVFSLQTLESAFLSNSKEAIWQLQPVMQYWNTEDARAFILTAAPIGLSSSKNIYLNNSLLAAFEAGDRRRMEWVGTYTSGSINYYFPYKYKSAVSGATVTEYLSVLRLSEQYLIRAEARAHQSNVAEAIADINIIRTRARAIATSTEPNPLPSLSVSLSQSQVLSAVLQERRVEFFAEWGHRWLDLKRTENIDAIMNLATPLKGGAWESYQRLYPIPYNEDILRNPNLVQNIGYQ